MNTFIYIAPHQRGRDIGNAYTGKSGSTFSTRKYPIENLAEALAEGIVSGHPDMPIFVFSPHAVDAIVAYLKSIQVDAPAN